MFYFMFTYFFYFNHYYFFFEIELRNQRDIFLNKSQRKNGFVKPDLKLFCNLSIPIDCVITTIHECSVTPISNTRSLFSPIFRALDHKKMSSGKVHRRTG